jgi:mycofactocin system FadH/OYE family oxidoreductase 1
MRILEPLPLGDLTAPNRVMFGPHVTNLGDDHRAFTPAHVAYYQRRAAGGCGIIVTEGASVHLSDWPYERAPLASKCESGWAEIAAAVRNASSDPARPALVIASLDHAGGQGSSAYSQLPLWAPSRVPEVNSREVPKWMEPADIAAVIEGFATAATTAMDAGLDGVEINAGQHSLIRQFCSGLTNQRDDEWGQDRLRFAREILARVRSSLNASGSVPGVLGLRLCADELAPWAGITPEMAPQIAAELASVGVDYLVVVRGSIYSTHMTRPDFHEAPGFTIDVTRAISAAVDVPVFLQGSIVDTGQAEWALGGYEDPAVADAVEMTRAQIADPDLVRKLAEGRPEQIRPCTLCNQTCQVRDARNPIVTCVGEPTSGFELTDPDWYRPAVTPRTLAVIGGGPAGLETARIAALAGHQVSIFEATDSLGGMAARSGPHQRLTAWLESECRRLGVNIELSRPIAASDDPALTNVDHVIQTTGAQMGERLYEVHPGANLIDIAALRYGTQTLPDDGRIAIHDPIGGPIAVALAEELGDRAVLITPDQIAGNELSRTGDLAPANVRLAQLGVQISRRSILREVHADKVVIEDRFSGERSSLAVNALVDCGFRLPTDPLLGIQISAGDCVAPRTVLEAIREGRRVVQDL